MGLALYYFYGNGFGQLPEGASSDQVMGHFVRTRLPLPLPGVIMAALLAAIMGTIAMIINGQANLIHRDILLRFNYVREGGKHDMLTCRLLSLICGMTGVGAAVVLFVISGKSSSTSLETMAVFAMVFAGMPVSWTFVVGMLVPRVSGKAMIISLIIGWILNVIMPLVFYYPVAAEKRVCFLWMTVPSDIAMMVLPVLLSFIWPNRKSLTNLSIWTVDKQQRPVQTDHCESNAVCSGTT
jgi:Na+/proline symporter